MKCDRHIEYIINKTKYFIFIFAKFKSIIFSNNIFPKQWKEFLILLIPKFLPGKVRPIVLASCLLKTLEKMIYFRLNFFIENNNILSPSQFGFRRNQSCLDCLSILISDYYISLAENKFMVIVPLDLKGAFDCVNPNILLNGLLDLNIPFNVRMFVYPVENIRTDSTWISYGFHMDSYGIHMEIRPKSLYRFPYGFPYGIHMETRQ